MGLGMDFFSGRLIMLGAWRNVCVGQFVEEFVEGCQFTFLSPCLEQCPLTMVLVVTGTSHWCTKSACRHR